MKAALSTVRLVAEADRSNLLDSKVKFVPVPSTAVSSHVPRGLVVVIDQLIHHLEVTEPIDMVPEGTIAEKWSNHDNSKPILLMLIFNNI